MTAREVPRESLSVAPYRQVGLVVAEWADGSLGYGTCSLIGRNDVLTATHVVYNPGKGGYAKNLSFVFGADYNSVTDTLETPGYRISRANWDAIAWPNGAFTDSNHEFFTPAESQYDIAVIGLQKPVGDFLSWLQPTKGVSAGWLFGSHVDARTIGYPAGSTGMMTEDIRVTASSTTNVYVSNQFIGGPGSSGGPLIASGLSTLDTYSSLSVIGVKSTASWWADLDTVYDQIVAYLRTNDSSIIDDVGPGPVAEDTYYDFLYSPSSPSSDLSIIFNEKILKATGTLSLRKDSLNGEIVEVFDINSTRISVSDKTLTVDPSPLLSAGTTYWLSVNTGSVKDITGNTNLYFFKSFSIPRDTTPPTIAITSNKTVLTVGQTAVITFTLSEASTDFVASDIAISGGTLSNFSGSGTSYSATFTPTANSTTAGVISVASGRFSDAAGNFNTDGSDANNSVTLSVNTLQNTSVTGTSGNNVLTSSAANESIDGGAGTDTVQFQGVASQYRLSTVNGQLRVTDSVANRDGTDTLLNIERLVFSNVTLNLVVDDAARAISEVALNRIAELYVAFFNRIPDGDGMAYWIGQYRAGRTINEIAESFFNAGVSFSSLTGYRPNMSHADFINVVYRNVLGRADGADAEGLAHWTRALASGTPKGSLVSSILDAAHGPAFSDPTNPYHSVQRLLDNKLAVAKQVSISWGVNYNTSDESISKGMAIAAAVTPTATTAAIALVGVDTSGMSL